MQFLHTGRWPSLAEQPSMTHYRQWGTVAEFFSGAAAAIRSCRSLANSCFSLIFADATDNRTAGSTAFFNQQMSCDCTSRNPFFPSTETRAYSHRELNLQAYFWWWPGWPDGLGGHFGHPPFLNTTACRPPDCPARLDWSLPLPDALTEVSRCTIVLTSQCEVPLKCLFQANLYTARALQVLAKLHPAAVIMNSGLWRNNGSPYNQKWPQGYSSHVVRAAEAAVSLHNGWVIWRTTTPTQDVNFTHSDDLFLSAAAGRPRVRVLDTNQMLQPLLSLEPRPYFDHVHFWPEVYTELNLALLNMLC